MSMMTSKDWITIKEAAYELGVSERTIQRLVAKQKLVCISLTGEASCLRITRESIAQHIERIKQQAIQDLI